MKKLLATTVVLSLSLFLTTAWAQTSNAKLQGVWKVVEVKTTGPDARTNSTPQPGMYIFTTKHYSVIRVLSDTPRPDQPADIAKATAAELTAAWGPFQAATGTYEISGDKITLRPMIAKAPQVMAGGSSFENQFKLEANTLYLTALRNLAGPVANPSTLKLTRVE